MARTVDLWLLKREAPARVRDAYPALARAAASGMREWRSTEGGLAYAYLPAEATQEPPAAANGADSWVRLACTQRLPGAAADRIAAFHYVVETDVVAEHEEQFNAWYDREHLPGLAAVGGTVQAARYVAAAVSPRYYACYDLVAADTLGCAAWLAVRNTPWSSRIRPYFCNTRRTMFRRVGPDASRD